MVIVGVVGTVAKVVQLMEVRVLNAGRVVNVGNPVTVERSHPEFGATVFFFVVEGNRGGSGDGESNGTAVVENIEAVVVVEVAKCGEAVLMVKVKGMTMRSVFPELSLVHFLMNGCGGAVGGG